MYEQQKRHFERILQIFNKNSDELLTWDEIAGLFGHNEKLKKDFEVGAGRRWDAMDFEDFRRFMKYETGTDSDTSQKEGEAGEPDIGEAGEGDSG